MGWGSVARDYVQVEGGEATTVRQWCVTSLAGHAYVMKCN